MLIEETRAALRSVKQAIYPLTSKLVTNTVLVEGHLKGTDQPFRTLFVHNCLFNTALMARMYERPPEILQRRRIGIPSLGSMIRSRQGQFDLCIAVVPKVYDTLFSPLCSYRGQEEVRQVIDTSGTWEEVRARFSKKKRQLTNNFGERYGLTYRISHSEEDFDFFYHRMHVPHIRRRYGDLSEMDSHASMLEFFRKGFVLFVLREGEPVAGALSLIEGDSILFRRSGVLDGDESHVKGGAQTALYYFQLRHAVNSGYRSVDTMKSAPFLNDGVFCHKADWGARAMPDREARQSVLYFVPEPDARTVRFFEINPAVVCEGNGLAGIAGGLASPDGADMGSQAIAKRFQVSGLDHFTSLTLSGGGQVSRHHA
ncbi:GNAT family N-acetyltransferase [Sphaerotilus sp.]|uniref:GNAT family N-acetyltransferase n=1 Tax=Sphaerotilus sp. TaxID=2093942 RepID=UPI0034E1C077